MHDTDPSPRKSDREPSISLTSVIVVSLSPIRYRKPWRQPPPSTALLYSVPRSIMAWVCAGVNCLTMVTMLADDNNTDRPKMSLYATLAKDPIVSHTVTLTYAI